MLHNGEVIDVLGNGPCLHCCVIDERCPATVAGAVRDVQCYQMSVDNVASPGILRYRFIAVFREVVG